MLRIDENTYIDETLITCAEYQLFVDQMREQGKYHQPDHWGMYQFQPGQANSPILGIRKSDAIRFCGWLQQRNDTWMYRLPTQQAANRFPILPKNMPSVGYWLEDESLFSWIGTVPRDARKINDQLEKELEPYLEQALQRALDRALDEARYFDLEEDETPQDPFDPLQYQSQEEARRRREKRDAAVENTQARHRIRVEEVAKIRRRFFGQSFPMHLDNARALNNGHVWNLVLLLRRDLTLDRQELLNHEIAQTRSLIFEWNFDWISDIPFAFLLDLLTLRERMAGHSPPFEGIRVVKERLS
jgi:hypothetical protein